jgi:predicted esterase
VLPHVEGTRVVGKPVLVVHGKRDPKLGVELARWAKAQLEHLQLNLTYAELQMGHEITGDSLGQASTWLTAQLDEGDRQPQAATPR